MNLENFKRLQEHLVKVREVSPKSFTMAKWNDFGERLVFASEHPCGTAGCIAGHAAALAGSHAVHEGVRGPAREWLGLNSNDAYDLFFGEWASPDCKDDDGEVDLGAITLDDAIAHIDSLIADEEARRAEVTP